MEWLYFSLTTALTEALRDLWGKKLLIRADPLTMAWAMTAFPLPFLWPWLPEPLALSREFLLAAAASTLVNSAAVVFYVQGLRASDISLSLPLLSYSPLFLLLVTPLMGNVSPSLTGIAGVVLIVAGTSLLQSGGGRNPWRGLFSQSGPRHMLAVAFLWSFGANLDKIGIAAASPLTWGVTVFAMISLALTPVLFLEGRWRGVMAHWPGFVGMGALTALSLASHMMAMNLTLVAYAIAVKRTSVLFSVLLGALVLGEPHLARRFPGALVMFLGMAVILFS